MEKEGVQKDSIRKEYQKLDISDRKEQVATTDCLSHPACVKYLII